MSPPTGFPDFDSFATACRACSACVSEGLIPAARPVFAGSPSAPLLLVGQAPGPVEQASGLPFSGRSGRELWRWMARAGFASESEFRSLCYISAMMRCFPGRAASGLGDRRPPAAAVSNCSRWLSTELSFLRPRGILLVGQLAIGRFLGSGSLTSFVGRSFPYYMGDLASTLIPLPHPSGQSRWLNLPAHRSQLESALSLVSELRGSLYS